MIKTTPPQMSQTGYLLSTGIGLQVIAAIQVVEAIGLVVAIVGAWNPEDPGGSLIEAMFWVLLAILLLTIGWGLWMRRAWARLLALVLHWPAFAGALVLFPLCLLFLLLAPARGIAVGHVFAWIGLIVLPPALLLSGWIVWYLHRRTLR